MGFLNNFDIEHNPRHKKIIIAGIIGCLFIITLTFKDTFFATPKVERTLKSIKVEVESARRASISRTITAVGTLRANQSVTVKPLVNGKVSQIFVEGGQEVKLGDPIISIDDRKYRNKLKEAEAKMGFANLEYSRYNKLVNVKYGKKRLQEKALSDKKEAEALFDQANKEIEDSIISAPFEGVISFNDISIGMPINENTEIFTINDLDPIKVDFRIPAQYLRNITVGQTVKVTIDNFSDQKIDAQVDAINATVDASAHTIAIRAIIDNKNALLRPGLFARIDVEVGSKDNALVLPSSSVQVNGDEQWVYKLTYYGKEKTFVALKQPVTTGFTEKDKTEIIRGLEDKDLIITVGHQKVRDGVPVTFEGDELYLKQYAQEADAHAAVSEKIKEQENIKNTQTTSDPKNAVINSQGVKKDELKTSSSTTNDKK